MMCFHICMQFQRLRATLELTVEKYCEYARTHYISTLVEFKKHIANENIFEFVLQVRGFSDMLDVT